METLPQWIFGFLLISLTGAHGLNYFPENFVVAKRNDAKPIRLTCGPQSDAGAVTWKFNGDGDLEDNVQQEGQNLIVSEVETPMLGEYSCWRGEEKLSSTYLLLENEEEEELDTLLRCRAKSYDCTFSCLWTHGEYTAVRLGLGQECREDQKSCEWVTASNSKRDMDGGFQFELSHSLSPYAEESTMLELTAQAIINNSVLRRTKRFYLRDIVQPDSPQIVRCQEVEEDLSVTIAPPSSWSTPHSFFSLEHEIEYMLKDDGQTGRSSSGLIPKRISKLRVRSRDSLVLSPWSQWTPWRNVRTGKKNPCRCKKQANKGAKSNSPDSRRRQRKEKA